MKATPHALRWTALAAGLLAGSAAQAYDCTGVPEWSASAVYTAGQKARQNNAAYQANWWTQNNSPAANSGPWAAWKPLGACDTAGPDTTPPGVPGTPSASAITTDSITVSWGAVTDNPGGSGLDGYELLRGGSLLLATPGTSHKDTGLSPGTAYSYQVRARDKAGNVSALSGTLLTSTASGPCTSIPTTPGGLAAPTTGSNSVTLSWNAVPAGANCSVQYRVLQGSTPAAQTALTQASITGLVPSTSYSFSVVAFSQAGASQPSAPITVKTTGATDKTVLGYFAQWGIYGRNYLVKNIETSGSAPLLTHINYAFGNVRNKRCEVGVTQAVNESTGAGGDAFADYTKSFSAAQSVDGVADTWNQPLRGNWNQLRKLKAKYPKLKLLISLGGWTYSRGFSEAAQPEHRAAFVKSCIDAYIKGDLPRVEDAGGPGALAGVFDGIDIDWEYPNACGLACGKPEDRENFTALLAEFRRQLDAYRPGLLLTMAAPAGVDKIRAWDPDKAHPYLDFINVMTYDFHGGWDPITGFHSPLYASSADPASGDVRLYNSDDGLKAYLARNVPAAKLNLGIGFYGRGWTNVPNVGQGLYQSGVPAPATWEKGNEDYKVLKTLNWPSFVDAQSRAQWIYNGSTFWSFDTPVQIREKMDYVKTRGLGGAFFWEFNGDDAQGTLIKAISEGLK